LKILLVGGLGFIGRNFIDRFLNRYKIIIYEKQKHLNEIQKFIDLKNLEIETGSILENKISEVIVKHKPDVVIHLAALTGLKNCEEDPEAAFKVNVDGTINVIQGCIQSNSKLIFISSREVYGETLGKKSKEDDSLLPKNVYGITKMIGEILIKNEGEKNNLDFTILRLSNVYGPQAKHGVCKIINDAVKKNKITIYGGDQKINLIYISDVVELLNQVINDNLSSKQTFNVGSQESISISDFANKVSNLIENHVSIEKLPNLEMENKVFIPNLKKIEKILRFSARINLEEGLKKIIKN